MANYEVVQRGPFCVAREMMPRKPQEPGDPPPRDDDDFGGEYAWCFAVPWVFRPLASPRALSPMPANPERTGSLDQARGYWNSLLYLITYSFGWSRPDRGFEWWRTVDGEAVDDPRFQLISQVWGADGRLDWFTAFLLSQDYSDSNLSVFRKGFDARPVEFDQRWVEAMKREQEAVESPGPEGKHLTVGPNKRSHSSGPVKRPARGGHLHLNTRRERSGVFTTDSALGWYRSLVEAAEAKINFKHEPDWRIDVFVRPFGFLGTYRHSWETGLWFSGKHRYHTVGN